MDKQSINESTGKRRLFQFLNLFYWLSFLADFPWTLIGNSTIDKAAETDKGQKRAIVILAAIVGIVLVFMALLLLWAFLL